MKTKTLTRAVNWYDLRPGDNMQWHDGFKILLFSRGPVFGGILNKVYVCYDKQTDRVVERYSFSQVFDIEVKTNNDDEVVA